MNKVKSNTFSLNDYQRHIPNSKKAINQDIITLITNSLSSNSHESTVITNQNEPVYFLEKPKSEIYKQFKSENSNLKLSISKFYKLCPKILKNQKN